MSNKLINKFKLSRANQAKLPSKFNKQTLVKHWRYLLIVYLILNLLIIIATVYSARQYSSETTKESERNDSNLLTERNLAEAVVKQRYKNLIKNELIEYGYPVDNVQPAITKKTSSQNSNERPLNF